MSRTLTIVTPVKNGARYLQPCLDSIAHARERGLAIEHLVIDGASTDGTLDMLAAAKDSTVFVEPALNSIEAMEFGRDRASGEYIMMLMADDLLAPNASSLVQQVWRDHPESGLAIFACELFRDDDGSRRVAGAPKRIWSVLNKYPGINSAMARREVFAAIAMPKDYKLANDRAMMLRLWAATDEIVVSDEPIAYMRLHPESASNAAINQRSMEGEFMKLALDLFGYNEKGAAADIFAAYAWRRFSGGGGRMPKLTAALRLPAAWWLLGRRGDALAPKANGAWTTPFTFRAGP